MDDARTDCLVLKIEGLYGGHCWGAIPDYGAALGYTRTLVDAPSVPSGKLNPIEFKSSIASWDFALTGAAKWFKTMARPLSRLTVKLNGEALPGFTNLMSHERLNSVLGAIGTYLVIDRETVRRFSGADGSQAGQIVRGELGSEVTAHRVGALIWHIDTPPAMEGRLVTLYRVPRTGGSEANSEVQANVLARGRISREVRRTDEGNAEWSVDDRGSEAEIGRDATLYRAFVGTPALSVTLEWPAGSPEPYRPAPPPLHSATGGYLYVPKLEVVVGVSYDDAAGVWNGTDAQIVDGDRPIEVGDAGDYDAYQVVWSGADRYQTFGYLTDSGVFIPSANGAIVARNLLVSTRTGGNGYLDGQPYSYDRGAYLWPKYALGIPEERLDQAAWRECIDALDNTEARALWLGGPKSRKVYEVIRGLLAPGGYTLVVTRSGLFRPVRMGDVYPGDGRAVTALEGIQGQEALGRPLDRIVLETDPGPDQEARTSVAVSDLTGADWHPRESGGAATFPLAPYRATDLQGQTSELAGALAGTLRRFAQRVDQATASFGPDDSDIEPGDPLTVSDPVITDPTTGEAIGSGTVSARPSQVRGEVYDGIVEATLVVLPSDSRLGKICPSAEVTAWDGDAITATVKRQRYAKRGELDAHQFEVPDDPNGGPVVALYTRNGVPLSDVTGAFRTAVAEIIGARQIRFDGDFLDDAGDPVTPAVGNIISYTYYVNARDYGPAIQTSQHAFQATGGLGTEELDGDDPYRWGE